MEAPSAAAVAATGPQSQNSPSSNADDRDNQRQGHGNSGGVESPQAMRRIFNKLDIGHDGLISTDDLRTVLRALRLFPTLKKLKDMVAEVDINRDGAIDFDEFCAMRTSNKPSELNVLAQFTKFNISQLFRGFITEDCVRKVLVEEGYAGSALESYVSNFMATDTNKDGKVSYRDLRERLLGVVPDEWLQWIWENVDRGVADKTILKILEDNGFKPEVSSELLSRTKREGRLTVERTYADHPLGYVYQVRM
eukprot:ANDGO_04798.mRNA.1 Calmodulin-like protein 7